MAPSALKYPLAASLFIKYKCILFVWLILLNNDTFFLIIYFLINVSPPETIAASLPACWKIQMCKVFSVTVGILRVSRGTFFRSTHQYKLSVFVWIGCFLWGFCPSLFGAYAPHTTLMHIYARRGCTPSIICTSIFPDKQSL